MRRAWVPQEGSKARCAKRVRTLQSTGAQPLYPLLTTDLLVLIFGLLPVEYECVWRCLNRYWRGKYPMGRWNITTAMLRFTGDPACQDLAIFAVRNWRWPVMLKGETIETAWDRIARSGSRQLLTLFARYSSAVFLDKGREQLPLGIRCEVLKVTYERLGPLGLTREETSRALNTALKMGDVDTIEWIRSTTDLAGFLFDAIAVNTLLSRGFLSVYEYYHKLGRIKCHLRLFARQCIQVGWISGYYWATKQDEEYYQGEVKADLPLLGQAVLSSGHTWLIEEDLDLLASVTEVSATEFNLNYPFRVSVDRGNLGVIDFIFGVLPSHSRAGFIIGSTNHVRDVDTLKYLARNLHGENLGKFYHLLWRWLGNGHHHDTAAFTAHLVSMIVSRKACLNEFIVGMASCNLYRAAFPDAAIELFAGERWFDKDQQKNNDTEKGALTRVVLTYRPSKIPFLFKLGILDKEQLFLSMDAMEPPFDEKTEWVYSRTLHGWCIENAQLLDIPPDKVAAYKGRLAMVIGGPGEPKARGRPLDVLSTALLKQTKRIQGLTEGKTLSIHC